MKYIIFLKNRIGGGRYLAYFDSGYFHIQNENRTVYMKDVKRMYLIKNTK